MISPSVLDCFELVMGSRLVCRGCDGSDPWEVQLQPDTVRQNLAELVYVAAAHLDQGHYRLGPHHQDIAGKRS